jgi:hypothetical protein
VPSGLSRRQSCLAQTRARLASTTTSFGFKGKSGNKGGKFASKHSVGKKKDTSYYICRLCNTKGHGPWDKNDKGDWVCPKKVSGAEKKAARQHLAVAVL